MRIQTSLEFLLILSIVAILGFGVLLYYGKGIAANKQVLGSFDEQQANQSLGNLSMAADPQLSIYIPLNSTLLSGNIYELDVYGCSNGTLEAFPSSGTVDFSSNAISAGFRNLAVLTEEFEPTKQGTNNIQLDYNLTCSGSAFSSSRSFETYASSENQAAGQLSAFILRRNESVIYGSTTGQILGLQQSNHCTITDVWTGSAYTIGGQCGTANAWEYSAFDGSCLQPYWSYSRTYCIVPVPTGYNISTLNQYNFTEAYDILLSVYTPEGMLVASLSDLNRTSDVTMGGAVVGNASVVGISYGGSDSGIEEVWNQSAEWVANDTDYQEYLQDKNNLYSTLSFYNHTGGSSAIGVAISAYNSSSASLIGSRTTEAPSCASSGSRYLCAPEYPFSYTIDVNLSSELGLSNNTVYAQGSEINIFQR